MDVNVDIFTRNTKEECERKEEKDNERGKSIREKKRQQIFLFFVKKQNTEKEKQKTFFFLVNIHSKKIGEKMKILHMEVPVMQIYFILFIVIGKMRTFS